MSENTTTGTSAQGQPALDAGQYELQRRTNRQAVEALGLSPYGTAVNNLISLDQARGIYDEDANVAFNANSKTPGYVDPRPIATVAGQIGRAHV